MCKVSIIIPCYNVDSKLFYRCLSSIEAQTFSDYEVIVVDDGSAQDYTDVFCGLEEKYKNISLFHQKNRGVSAARNFGLKKSHGKYITFVDADDYMTPNFLEESIEIAETYQAEIVMGMNITTYNTNLEEYLEKEDKRVLAFENDDVRKINKWMLGTLYRQGENAYLGQGPWNRLVDRNLAIRIPFDESLPVGEDIVWNLKLLQESKRVCIASNVWYVYYMNPVSSSRKYRKNAIDESRNSLLEMKKLLDMEDDSQYKSYCLRCWSDLKRIYRCYLSYDYRTHKSEEIVLFQSVPWNELGSKKFSKLCNFKQRYMRWLYVSGLLFEYYHIKTLVFKK